MNQPLHNPITEDDIAHFLSNTPDFFLRHAELLASVQFTSPHSHRTVGLQERQAEMLREKIRALEQRLMDMIRYGNDNVVLSDRVLRLARTLLLCAQPAELAPIVLRELHTQFAVPQAGLRLWGVAPDYASLEAAQPVSDDVRVFAASLSEPFCGLNTGFEAVRWLPEPDTVASLALIPLRHVPSTPTLAGEAFGLLILASPDAQRYHSGMGTDLLARLGDLVSAALTRLF